MITDRTGQPGGFGVIQVTTDAVAERAIVALNGMDLDGKALRVS
jgi:hypothetical protein